MTEPFLESSFRITKMDCPSEELIRAALAPISADARLEFEIPRRRLTIWHRDPVACFAEALEALDLVPLTSQARP